MSDNNYQQSLLNKAYSNKFNLLINLPDFLKEQENIYFRNLKWSIYGTMIPEIKTNFNKLAYGGQHLSVPALTRQSYESLNIFFKIDNEWKNYFTVYNWLKFYNDDIESIFDKNSIIPLSDDEISKAPSKYRIDLSLFALDETNKPVAEFIFKQAYPVGLKHLDIENKNDQEIDCTATFEYSQMVAKTITDNI